MFVHDEPITLDDHPTQPMSSLSFVNVIFLRHGDVRCVLVEFPALRSMETQLIVGAFNKWLAESVSYLRLNPNRT